MAKISLKEICLFLFPLKQVDLPFHELSNPFVSANATHVLGLNTAQQRDFLVLASMWSNSDLCKIAGVFLCPRGFCACSN